jgi:hypothetical protein
MDLTPRESDLLETYLAPFRDLTGDRRTARLLDATVLGILGGERLVCSRIAAFSPGVGRGHLRREASPPHAAGHLDQAL